MQSKSILVATLVLPLLVIACNRDQSPMSSATDQDKQQAMAPSNTPDNMLENAPPAAGMIPSEPNNPATVPNIPDALPPSVADSPAESAPQEPKKEY